MIRTCGARQGFLRRLIQDVRGVAAIGLGLIMPGFMCSMYGIIEFSRYAYAQGALLYAAEETTRYASLNFDASIDQLVEVASQHAIGIDKSKINSITVDETLNAVDQTKLITVEIGYDHEFLLPIFSAADVTVQGTSRGSRCKKKE